MTDTLISECIKFEDFFNSVKPEDYHQHLKYLYSFIKLLFSNVKRPFALYEECLQMIVTAHTIITNEIRISEHPLTDDF